MIWHNSVINHRTQDKFINSLVSSKSWHPKYPIIGGATIRVSSEISSSGSKPGKNLPYHFILRI